MLQKLKASHRKQVGTTESPTTDMYGDCQELLQLFGLPYIIAPAEAEAQCAWLDAQGLVDGVVTDDNDAFLFGAKHIYRYVALDLAFSTVSAAYCTPQSRVQVCILRTCFSTGQSMLNLTWYLT